MFPKWPYDLNPVKAEWMDSVMNFLQFFLNLERETKTFYSNVAVGCKLWPDFFQKKSMGFFLPKPLAKKRCITLPPKATFNPTSPHPPIACAGAKELQTWMKKC